MRALKQHIFSLAKGESWHLLSYFHNHTFTNTNTHTHTHQNILNEPKIFTHFQQIFKSEAQVKL